MGKPRPGKLIPSPVNTRPRLESGPPNSQPRTFSTTPISPAKAFHKGEACTLVNRDAGRFADVPLPKREKE